MLDRDGPVILGCVIVTSIAIVATNVVVDVVYGAPRPAHQGDAARRRHSLMLAVCARVRQLL